MNECNQVYDIHFRLEDFELYDPNEVLLIDCPHCSHVTFYKGSGMFNDACECCGWEGLHEHDENAYTVADYCEFEFSGYGEVENFNLI